MKDEFTRSWIIKNSEEIAQDYEPGILTVRGMHYQLVTRFGMTNSIQHYKRVVSAMEKARWNGTIPFETFSDLEREMVGTTEAEEIFLQNEIECGKDQIKAWMNNYSRNKWENQPCYAEVFIEKKALLGVFGQVCRKNEIALGACKGYPSLTFLHQAQGRFYNAVRRGQKPVILYFGDYDPSGEDIPRSIEDNLSRFGVEVEVRRFALLEDQVIKWGLPLAPTKVYKIAKRKDGSTGYVGDSRDKNWNGLGQVELDAVEPRKLQSMCEDAIESVFDNCVYAELMEQESDEREEYRQELKSFVEQI